MWLINVWLISNAIPNRPNYMFFLRLHRTAFNSLKMPSAKSVIKGQQWLYESVQKKRKKSMFYEGV